jgi:carboxyl-terminal processing protease
MNSHGRRRVVVSAVLAASLAAWPGARLRAAPPAPAAVAASTAAAASDKTYEKLKVLIDVLNLIQENYVEQPDTQKLIEGAASGMVRTLDPFSQYMDEEQHKEIKTETEGQFGGLGIRIGMKDDWLTVITPLPGTPAYRAGILPSDRLIEIDGETTKDMTLPDALDKLRGAPGTKVSLTLLRGPDGDGDGPWVSKIFPLTRETVKIESVQSWIQAPGIGYLRIIEFSGRTAEDTAEALKDLRKQGAKALVLDLRNNPGGLLTAAVEIAGDFLGENKLIVYTQGRKADSRQEFHAGPTAAYGDMPLIVLINGGSASASEIVSGAMQDHHRAVILGAQSYGKASVQSVIPLADGSGLRLTVAHYYTPLGRSIHRDEKAHTGGITPDIVVAVPRDTEAKLYNQWDLIYAQGKKPKSNVRSEELVKDDALQRAVELLKAREVLGSLKVKEG